MSLSRQQTTNYVSEERKLLQRLRSESLLNSHPDLVAEQWDYERNFWGPEFFGHGAGEVVSWICRGPNKDTLHRFRKAICVRTSAWSKHSKFRGCPVCAQYKPLPKKEILAVAFPELAREWVSDNGYSASSVLVSSGKLAEWQCPLNDSHVYKSKISARTGRIHQGCPQCFQGESVNLSVYRQALALYDRGSRNRGFNWKRLPVEYKVFWTCQKYRKHRWYESFSSLESRDFQCLLCQREGTAKLSDFPHLMEQVHPTRNGRITHIRKLPAVSRTAIVWTCACGHVWQATIAKRTAGDACPQCMLSSNQHGLDTIRFAKEGNQPESSNAFRHGGPCNQISFKHSA